jgi:hypothetical protein
VVTVIFLGTTFDDVGQNEWTVKDLDSVFVEIRWWSNTIVVQRIHLFGSRTVLVAILVQEVCARASHLPLYQAPNILGFIGQDQFHDAQFCLV